MSSGSHGVLPSRHRRAVVQFSQSLPLFHVYIFTCRGILSNIPIKALSVCLSNLSAKPSSPSLLLPCVFPPVGSTTDLISIYYILGSHLGSVFPTPRTVYSVFTKSHYHFRKEPHRAWLFKSPRQQFSIHPHLYGDTHLTIVDGSGVECLMLWLST